MYLLIGLIIWSCSPQNTSNATLDEAYEIHKAIRESQKQVVMDLATLETITDKEDEIKRLKENYIEWKNDILEVPGYPHIHIEGDDHSHHQQPSFPDEQILSIQKESKKRIDEIQQAIKTLKEEEGI